MRRRHRPLMADLQACHLLGHVRDRVETRPAGSATVMTVSETTSDLPRDYEGGGRT